MNIVIIESCPKIENVFNCQLRQNLFGMDSVFIKNSLICLIKNISILLHEIIDNIKIKLFLKRME